MVKKDKLYSFFNTEIDWVYYYFFYETAASNFNKIQKYVKKRGLLETKGLNELFENEHKIILHSITVVIFCALTLEGFINHYGFKRFSKDYFKNHLERIKTPSKWVLFPELSIGKTIDKSSLKYTGLDNLFSLRNKLAHSKTKRRKMMEAAKNEIKEKDAKRALQTTYDAINWLHKVDNKVDVIWIEQVNARFQIHLT